MVAVRRLVPVLAPFVALGLVVGCPRDQGAPASVDASPSTSASAVAAAASSPAWPKVVVVPGPAPSTTDGSEAGAADPALEAIEELDAALDEAGADADAADVADVQPKHDAYDDAALLGTKTYSEETEMRGIRRITADAAKVRKAPRNGDVIATLQKGTEISLVAEIFDWYRVRYTDPNTGVRRQGWIYVTTVAGPRAKTCPPGWDWHPQDGGWCDRECKKNTDCKALKGYKCSGTLCFYAAD